MIVYTKTGCPWCRDVLAYLRENNISFEERNLFENDAFRGELEAKSGQTITPTLDIDGYIMADSDVEQVREYFEKNK